MAEGLHKSSRDDEVSHDMTMARCPFRLKMRVLALLFALSIKGFNTGVAMQNTSVRPPSIPEMSVVDQHGNRLDFHRDLIANKTVAINFIYTACTSSCPLSAIIFSQMSKKWQGGKLQLISISVDPANDTPERLLEFSKKFANGADWRLITGEKAVIEQLLKQLGAFAPDRDAHPNMVIVGNAANSSWLRLYGFPEAKDILRALTTVTGGRVRK
jgi:protein SCO1/2